MFHGKYSITLLRKRDLMNDAMGQVGSDNLMLFEDEDALLEMDTQLGPDAIDKDFQYFPNFDIKKRKKKRRLKKVYFSLQ